MALNVSARSRKVFMRLSVIIPNYNNEKYIAKCLDSVLEQTLRPDEILVVDDASTDSSVGIIRQYAEKHANVIGIYLSENGGVSHARNTGIKAATGDCITTLDADDFYYNPEKLENEMRLLEQKGGNVLTYSKIVYCDETDEIIRYLDYPNRTYFQGNVLSALLMERITKTLMRDCCYPRQAALDAGLYDETSCLFEDYDFLIRLAKRLPFYCTFAYGTAYRQKEGGLSARPPEECRAAKNAVIEKNCAQLAPWKRMYCSAYRKLRNMAVRLLK